MATNRIKSNQRKVIAHDYYKQGLTQVEICEKIGISAPTLRKWIAEGSWQKELKCIAQTRQALLQQYHEQLSELNRIISSREQGKRFPTKAEADVSTQLINNIKKIEFEASVSEIISVMVSFLNFLRDNYPDKTVDISNLIDSYIKTKI